MSHCTGLNGLAITVHFLLIVSDCFSLVYLETTIILSAHRDEYTNRDCLTALKWSTHLIPAILAVRLQRKCMRASWV